MPQSSLDAPTGTPRISMATAKTSWVNGQLHFYFVTSFRGLGSESFYLSTRFKRTGKRNEIFLATKFGITPTGADGRPEYVRSSVEKSLKRLGVDQIDLYYLHVSDFLQYA